MIPVSAEPPVGGTIDHILSILPSLIPSAQRVAMICVERPADVVEMSGADLAAAAQTSAATVSRMCQALGFRGYQHLRFLLVRDLGAAARPAAPADGTAGWLREEAANMAAAIEPSLSTVDADAFDSAAAVIVDARRLLIAATGGSQPPAQSVSWAFIINGRACEAPTDAVVQQLTASVLNPGDVCLAVSSSGANSATLAVAKAAAKAGATVVAVTAFARSPLTEFADIVLVAGARSQVWSASATLGSSLVQVGLLSMLQVAVAQRMGETAVRARAAATGGVLAVVADEASVDDVVRNDPDER